MVWNDEAYGHLVYPEEQKDLVLTFVDNHQRLKGGVDDVIMGKGLFSSFFLSLVVADKNRPRTYPPPQWPTRHRQNAHS